MEKAHELFDKMPQTYVISLNGMILYKMILLLMKEVKKMQLEGVRADSITHIGIPCLYENGSFRIVDKYSSKHKGERGMLSHIVVVTLLLDINSNLRVKMIW